MKSKLIFKLGLLYIFLLVCKPDNSLQDSMNSQKEETNPQQIENKIALTEAQRKTITIQIEQAKLSKMENTIGFPGVIEADPDKVETIGTKISGRITKIYKKEGELVRRGEPLVAMESPEIPILRSKHQALQAKWEAAYRNKERLKKLYEEKLVSEQEKKFAEAEEQALRAELESNKENLKLFNIDASGFQNQIQLVASLNGIVLERYVLPGETVNANTKILKIGDIQKVFFRVSIYEKDLSYVRLHQNAKIVFQAFPNREFYGKVVYISPVRDPETGGYIARILLENSKLEFKIGLAGQAVLEVPWERMISGTPNQNPTINQTKNATNTDPILAYSSEEKAIVDLDTPGVFIYINDLEYEWIPIQILAKKEGIVYWLPIYPSSEIHYPPTISYVKEGAYYLKAIFLKSQLQEE